ncbi:MAG: glycoside hydrolase family 43 protein [Firmicutes bacterium]|nr:glycoside hydrolase family 43 protein [Bacillota bacterium]MDY5531942.1 glycoside hydrolase family 43 protein [Pumilibacteraceae bacterium]
MKIIGYERGGTRDPWIFYRAGYFYHCFSRAGGIAVSKSKTLEGLATAEPVVVYVPESGKPYSKELWAPELYIIDDKCYIYVACDDGNNCNHRMYVLYNDSADPQAEYKLKGKIFDRTDKWAIDGTVLKYGGKLYFAWSGWEGDINTMQNIYIAEMSDPFTICSDRVLISTPQFDWELHGANGTLHHPYINEGPVFLQHNGKLYLVYSASGSWCNDYCLGRLDFLGGDILKPENWVKEKTCQFARTEDIKGPGHCSFFEKDGVTFMAYHAFREDEKYGWGSADTRVQPIKWENDVPVLGIPE